MLSSMQPPKGFIVSQDAGSKIGQSINIIGVVTDYLPPAPSKGADWQCSLNIIDSLEFLSAKVGLRIKFFRPRELLPEVESLGSIALCRNIKVKQDLFLLQFHHLTTLNRLQSFKGC